MMTYFQLLVYAYINVLHVHQIGGHLSIFISPTSWKLFFVCIQSHDMTFFILQLAMALLYMLFPITELDYYMYFIR